MRTLAAIVTNNLAQASADARLAEALISEYAANHDNTISIMRLLYAATIVGLAEINLRTAYDIVHDVKNHEPEEVIPHG